MVNPVRCICWSRQNKKISNPRKVYGHESYSVFVSRVKSRGSPQNPYAVGFLISMYHCGRCDERRHDHVCVIMIKERHARIVTLWLHGKEQSVSLSADSLVTSTTHACCQCAIDMQGPFPLPVAFLDGEGERGHFLILSNGGAL